MLSGVSFQNTFLRSAALKRSARTALLWIAFTLASFSNARSLVVREDVFVPPASVTCPNNEERMKKQADQEFESIQFKTTSTSQPNLSIAAEAKTTKTFSAGVTLFEKPSLFRVIEKTFESVDVTPQLPQLSLCTDAVCVLKTYLGSEEAAKRLLTIALRTGFVVSLSPEHTAEYQDKVVVNGIETTVTKRTSSVWTLSELRRLSQSAKIIPFTRMKIATPVTLYRTGISSSIAGEASTQSWIRLYAGAFQNDERPWDGAENATWTDKVLIHEYCHLIDYQGYNEGSRRSSRSQLDKYQPNTPGASRWGQTGTDATFVTDYAKTSNFEDFAEACAYFLLAPSVLMDRAPAKYAAMKDLLFKSDFTNAEWNQPLFPEVEQLIAGPGVEDRCESDVIRKAGDVSLMADGRATEVVSRTATMIRSLRHSQWGHTSSALNESREGVILDSLHVLESSPTFCDRGGEEAFRLRTAAICSRTQKKLVKISKPFPVETLNAYATECVNQSKNLDSSCVDAKVTAWALANATDDLSRAFANRYKTAAIAPSIQAAALKNLQPKDWLVRCLTPIGSASDATGSITYTLRGPSTTAGSFFRSTSDASQPLNGIQSACLAEVRNALREKGYTVPAAWTPAESTEMYSRIPLLSSTFYSFEQKLLGPVLKAVCPVGSTCSEEKVRAATVAWIGLDTNTLPVSSTALAIEVKRLANRVR